MVNKEIKRKIAHLGTGLFIVLGIYYNYLETKHIFFLLIFFTALSFLSRKIRLPVASFLLENFERDKYIKKFPFKGMVFFLGGCLLTLKIFPEDIALASIMILTLGDSVSFLAGYFLGKTKLFFNKFKNIEGTLAGIFFAFIGSLFFVSPIEAFFSSLISMIVEGAGIKIGVNDIDDNFIVPLAAGTVIFLIRTEFSVFII